MGHPYWHLNRVYDAVFIEEARITFAFNAPFSTASFT
jgi:hypothetical protein